MEKENGDSFLNNIHLGDPTDYFSLIIEGAFPTREELIHACKLISQGKIVTESIEGLETAREIFQKEMIAQNSYRNSEFCKNRVGDLTFDATISAAEVRRLQEQGYTPDSPELQTAIVKNNTYIVALHPDQSIRVIKEALRYKRGDDFNDSDERLPFDPNDTPSDFPDIEK